MSIICGTCGDDMKTGKIHVCDIKPEEEIEEEENSENSSEENSNDENSIEELPQIASPILHYSSTKQISFFGKIISGASIVVGTAITFTGLKMIVNNALNFIY